MDSSRVKLCSRCGEREVSEGWCQPCRTERQREIRRGSAARPRAQNGMGSRSTAPRGTGYAAKEAASPVPEPLRRTLLQIALDRGLAR